MKNVRNFSIIAHIDHGKSTLADRLIQSDELIERRLLRDQVLDNNEIERERGITIKSQTIALYHTYAKERYVLNLIDTPGHVDFSYEVSRALASCEGVLLLIDASQGVEAQTIATLYGALEHDLEIVPVINKIDLPSANVEAVKEQIEIDLGLDSDKAILCSAKEGRGINDVIEAIIKEIPPPKGIEDDLLQALIFDAYYDSFRGVIIVCRVFDGTIEVGDKIRLMHNKSSYTVEELGVFRLSKEPRKKLYAGEVGYIIANIKSLSDTKIGDTVTLESKPAEKPLHGFKEVKPVVFSSIYPIESSDYNSLSDAMQKYILNDASLVYQKDSSISLGQGFRCGFLGLLHMDIVQERLEREYGQSIILTSPSIKYRFTLENGDVVVIDNPQLYPEETKIARSEELYCSVGIIIPDRYMGKIMELCLEHRGIDPKFNYPTQGRIEVIFRMPLAEIIYDFYDKLKTITQGYGSFDYEILDYRESNLVKMDILLNGEKIDALSQIIHKDRARGRALQICEKLKDEIPRHLFKIAIQGAVGGTIIARSTITPFRKDVTAKCYGGDITRKRKLLEKQKKGKKRMKMIGSVSVPQSAFISVLKSDND